MAEERCLFDRLDSLEAQNVEIKVLLKQLIQTQQEKVVQQPQQQQQPKENLFKQFIRRARKSWMWFGNKAEFKRWKFLAVFSLILLLLFGLASTITTAMSCGFYSPISIFENVWLIIGIIYLVYASKTQHKYEVNELAANSPNKKIKDDTGMIFLSKEKVVFRVFRWIAFVAVVANIIYIWTKPSSFNILATIFEVLFLLSMIFVFFMNLNLYAQYSIIYVEGYDPSTKVKKVFVLPPGAKKLITEEEFKRKVPFLFQ